MFQKIQTQRLTDEEIKNAQNDTLDTLYLSSGTFAEDNVNRNMLASLAKELGGRYE